MKEKILKALEEQYKIYGNSSGTTIWTLYQKTGIEAGLKELLEELIVDKKVKKQQGLNTTLYYLVK